jgi:hypothetical protein
MKGSDVGLVSSFWSAFVAYTNELLVVIANGANIPVGTMDVSDELSSMANSLKGDFCCCTCGCFRFLETTASKMKITRKNATSNAEVTVINMLRRLILFVLSPVGKSSGDVEGAAVNVGVCDGIKDSITA